MSSQEDQIYLAVIIGICFVLLLISFIAIIVLSNYRRIRKLQKQMVQALIVGSEDERLRISQYLHDDINPSLAIASMYLQMLELKNEENKELLNKSLVILNESIHKIRTLSHELSPYSVYEGSIFQIVNGYIEQIKKINKEEIIFINKAGDINLPEHYVIHICRIIQEGINNAIKHANATIIKLGFFKIENNLHIVIQDNGKGISTNTASMLKMPTSKGIGLKNIYNRAVNLNGRFIINSSPSLGTTLLIIIPLND